MADNTLSTDYGLVFGGGGALAAWEVGCAKRIRARHGDRAPLAVTGASAGALNAAAYWAGLGDEEVAGLWRGITPAHVYRWAVPPWRLASGIAGSLLVGLAGAGTTRTRPRRAAVISPLRRRLEGLPALFDTEPLRETLADILDAPLKSRAATEEAFTHPPMALGIVASDFKTGEPVAFYARTQKGEQEQPLTQSFESRRLTGTCELIDALMASTALPVLFPGSAGRYFDGGVLSNEPSRLLTWLATGMKLSHVYVLRPAPVTNAVPRGVGEVVLRLKEVWVGSSAPLEARMNAAKARISRALGEAAPMVVDISADSRPEGAGLLRFGVAVDALIEQGWHDADTVLKAGS